MSIVKVHIFLGLFYHITYFNYIYGETTNIIIDITIHTTLDGRVVLIFHGLTLYILKPYVPQAPLGFSAPNTNVENNGNN